VNVGASSNFATVQQLADLGVRRISVGGGLARAAWSGMLAAARELLDQGTFGMMAHAVPGADLNARFADPE
jgi:2-methylisocitrate lyase-like PEP mutase family enzyme